MKDKESISTNHLTEHLQFVMSNVAVPGQHLATVDGKLQAGIGTYVQEGSIFASTYGKWLIADDFVTVTRANKTVASTQVLHVGDVVVCRVTKITSRQVMADILCVSATVLKDAFPGTIRQEDVRNNDIDKLLMEEVFSPGMLVKAEVLSFGDTRSYFLSTAKPGLGVVRQNLEKN